ncbi:NUDIX hydrolase [bacterium]|nr:NUDIX hydrolase [bacterium]
MVLQKYTFAVIATDVAIFTTQDGELKVLLIAMKKSPYEGFFALPGGLVGGDESIDDAAGRHLFDKAGVRWVFLEQLSAFGEPDRDPLGRVVSVAYYALVPPDAHRLKTTKQYKGVSWFSVQRLPKLAYDHKHILEAAVARLRGKLAYSNIARNLLSREFTLGEMQSMYEIILGEKLDKRNFRKKMIGSGLLTETKHTQKGRANRPARLYTFKKKKMVFI